VRCTLRCFCCVGGTSLCDHSYRSRYVSLKHCTNTTAILVVCTSVDLSSRCLLLLCTVLPVPLGRDTTSSTPAIGINEAHTKQTTEKHASLRCVAADASHAQYHRCIVWLVCENYNRSSTANSTHTTSHRVSDYSTDCIARPGACP
jgi:hypothetical protein